VIAVGTAIERSQIRDIAKWVNVFFVLKAIA
jgi:hypothetical protein